MTEKRFFAIFYWQVLKLVTYSVASSAHPIIVLMAFDGMPQHFLQQQDHHDVANLQELLESGTSAEWMLHQFPSQTLPNLHSIATGLYPEYHGVLGDHTFDDAYECIGYGEKMYTLKANITPIWTLNEMSGEGRYSAVITWPGGEFEYANSSRPTYRLNVTDCPSWEARVDAAINWLTDASKPANLLLLHFETVAETTSTVVQRVDQTVGYYFKQLRQHAIGDKVNTIVVGDRASTDGSVGAMPGCDRAPPPPPPTPPTPPTPLPTNGSTCRADILENLRQASRQLNAFKASQYARLKYNFQKNGISQPAERFLDAQQDKIFVHPTSFLDALDNEQQVPGMFPLFIANGSLFEPNFVASPFENIDIYALISQVLKLKEPPTPINGSIKCIQNVLKVENQPVYDKIITKMILFVIVGMLLLACAWYILKIRKQERLRL